MTSRMSRTSMAMAPPAPARGRKATITATRTVTAANPQVPEAVQDRRHGDERGLPPGVRLRGGAPFDELGRVGQRPVGRDQEDVQNELPQGQVEEPDLELGAVAAVVVADPARDSDHQG